MNLNKVDKIIEMALEEDIAWGDITTESTVPSGVTVKAQLLAKEEGVICGIHVFSRVMLTVDASLKIELYAKEGQKVEKGKLLATVEGEAASILKAERVSLNLLQRMSGIATATSKLAEQVKGTNASVTDTRKTTPGLRILEKYAVRVGGGKNHRFNLADGVLIKDNHIRAAGGIGKAVKAARAVIPHTVKIEVETESLSQVEEALKAKADIIMLDNMDLETMRKAVKLIDGRALAEASGNMDSKDIRAVAETGVDIISFGSITHSVKAMDISLRF